MEEPSVAQQRAFAYSRDRWLQWSRDIPGAVSAIAELPSEVDRAAIERAVTANLEADTVEGAFTTTMIWGYGSVNYGPSRTLKVLSNGQEDAGTLSDAVTQKLWKSVDIGRADVSQCRWILLLK